MANVNKQRKSEDQMEIDELKPKKQRLTTH